nr:hemerythrin domain-containing protein [Cohnella mopanensis]
MPGADIREVRLETCITRAKQEHDLLKEELQDIFEQACIVRSGVDESRLNREIVELNENVKHFMKDWNEHTLWEESELFPYAAWLLGSEPDLYALMEQEYELADRSIREFVQTLERTSLPIGREEACRMTSYLIQAYAILKNRFKEEEEIMLELS